MPLTLTTEANLEEYAGGAVRLAQFSDGDSAAVLTAIYKASDMFRTAAIHQYTEASVDALTATTIPYEPRQHIEAVALFLLTIGDDVQPESHRYAYERAEAYFGRLRRGEAVVNGLTQQGGASSGTGRVRFRSAGRVYDRDNTDSKYDQLNPKIE